MHPAHMGPHAAWSIAVLSPQACCPRLPPFSKSSPYDLDPDLWGSQLEQREMEEEQGSTPPYLPFSPDEAPVSTRAPPSRA